MTLPSDNKKLFPIFDSTLKDWAYLDNAATTQKPQSVIQSISNFYTNDNANIHRGLYDLSEQATRHYENTRRKVKEFLNAAKSSEIAFTSGTTEAINIVAHSFLHNLNSGDEIVISAMEHHANLIPWQQLCLNKNAFLKIIPLTPNGDLDLKSFKSLVSSKTKLVALTHVSNTIGTINPIEEIITICHNTNVPVLIDAAQSVSHLKIDVSDLDVDFLVFSAHKMFGPMGTGVLFANERHHDSIRPLSFGGGAIKKVSFQETKFRAYPFSVEAGTPNVAGVIGLGTAIDFIQSFQPDELKIHSEQLAGSLREVLKSIPGITIAGNPKNPGTIISFIVNEIHAHDVASFLADKKIAVRAGHHCTQPLHEHMGWPATIRASFSIYNSMEDVERLIKSISELKNFWR